MLERQIDVGCPGCGGTGVMLIRPRKKGEISMRLRCQCAAGRTIAIVTLGK